ncbi:protein LplB [Spirochaetia bacterium]|nr:protein LplB [Spirochaetia bacterium]
MDRQVQTQLGSDMSTLHTGAKAPLPPLGQKKFNWSKHLKRYFWLYLFLLPGVVYLIIFKYIPMVGVLIAFEDYNNVRGVFGSPFVGLKHFRYLFESNEFYRVFANSLLLSLYRMAAGFPAPILLALLLNEIHSQGYKRVMQTILYLPHFISWVVIYGILLSFVSPTTGILNVLIMRFGGEPIPFMMSTKYFRGIVVLTDIWKGAGWGTVVYMASMAGIDPTYYEAAILDGAGRMKRILYVTLPMISGTIIVMLILRVGSLLGNGFEQIFLMQNALNSEVSEVLETYTYKVGLREGRFSFSTAVGLFQSVVGFVLIFITNKLSRKFGEGGLW